MKIFEKMSLSQIFIKNVYRRKNNVWNLAKKNPKILSEKNKMNL